jgi:hypothetical protein
MMRRSNWAGWIAVACVIVFPLLSSQQATAAVSPTQPSLATSQRVTATMMGMPLQFEANHGQVDGAVKFISRGSGYTLFLTPTESVMVLQQRETSSPTNDIRDPLATTEPALIKQSVVRMKLEGANPSPAIDGMEQLPGIVNYFIGNDPKKWRTKIQTYAKVQYKEAYPGIDLAYYGNQGKLEYDFIVAPGADPSQIKLAFEGASDIRVADSGDLVLTTALGDVRVQKPIVYQVEADGHKTLVAGNYLVSPNTSKGVGIQLAAYDHRKPVVIDPVLNYLTYLGGKQSDHNPSIAVDGGGNAYIAGETLSLDFPTTAGSYDPTFNANPSCPGITVTNTSCPDVAFPSVSLNADIFVAKLNPTATGLTYVTYLGGTGYEAGLPSIAIDLSGSAYVAAQTRSGDFPVTAGAFQTAFHPCPSPNQPPSNCSADGFVTKLDPTGSTLMYSTYFGGSGGDAIGSLEVDSGGNAFITGDIRSNDFPITPGAFSSTTITGLLAKLNPTGTALVWSTRLASSASTFFTSSKLALDSVGNVIVVGGAQGTIVPLVNPVQSVPGGNWDAFVWKFNPTGTALVFSTYLGGAGREWAYGVAVDASDNILVTGWTESANFPTTPGAFDTSLGGTRDMFVTKLMPSGSPMVYSTFLGGSGGECLLSQCDVKADFAGHAYVAGDTSSSDFPLVNPIDSSYSNGEIAVAKIKPDGSALVYSTFLGGTGGEGRPNLALGADGALYVTAYTYAGDLPVTPGVLQSSHDGIVDVFVAKITDKPLANAGPDQSVPEGTLVTLDGTGSTGGSLSYIWTHVSGPPAALSGATSAHPTFAAPHVPPAGGVVTFELVVCEGTSSNCSNPDSVNVHISNINQPPVADAGPDQTVQEGSPVLLDGTASYDPDVEPLTYQWTQLFGPAVTLLGSNTVLPTFVAPSVGAGGATIVFDLTVTDPHNLTGPDSVSIHVTNLNQVPVANAGPDQTVNENTLVTLNGTLSADPDLDALSFTWTQTAGPLVTLTGGTTASPTFTAPAVGAGGMMFTFRLVASDGQASSAADTVNILVQDTNDPPVCTLAQASPNLLWPPNHTMVPVSIMGVSDPNDQAITITFTAVTQDEPVNGLGDGDTSPDAAVSGNQILLRAERAGTGNGRVYQVHFTATDDQGGSCSGSVKVGVPHSKKDTAGDNGQLFNSFGP